MDWQIPKQIGRYKVDRLLGAGAMGFVYLSRDPELDRAVAIKTVRAVGLEGPSRETFLERFRNEARAAGRLHHPSIVQVYDVGEDPSVGPFLVFEYVAGSTLKKILQSRGPLDAALTLKLAGEVAEALDAAHAAGIIHRDIKPDNLLVTTDGRTKLADFGVARVPNAALTREGQFLGTPCYSAPETLKSGRYSVQSDLFSFAAVLYEAVSGVRAFPGDDAVAVAHKVLHEEPEVASAVARGAPISGAVDAVLRRGLAKEPAARFDSASELATALRRAFSTHESASDSQPIALPPPARIPSEFAHGVHGKKRSSGALAFWAVLAGALVVGVALTLTFAKGNWSSNDVIEDAGVPIFVEQSTTKHAHHAAFAHRTDATATPTADAGTALLAPTQGDASVGTSTSMDAGLPRTAHEREEAAKDALARARRSIRAGDAEQARAALEEARRYDPGNPDILALEAELQ